MWFGSLCFDWARDDCCDCAVESSGCVVSISFFRRVFMTTDGSGCTLRVLGVWLQMFSFSFINIALDSLTHCV